MKGKIGLVVGLGAGYVLGTRAGHERYEQIKTQWLKVWNLDPVQEQVAKVTTFAKSSAAAVPSALWQGAVKVVKSANSAEPGKKLDSAVATGKKAADDVADAVEDAVSDAQAAAKSAVKKPASTATKKPAAKTAAKKPAAKKSSTSTNGR